VLAQAPPQPPALTGAEVRQAGEDVLARLSFTEPLPPVGAQRVCVTFHAGRVCLRGRGARVAQRRHGAWVVVGRARTTRDGNDVVVDAGARKLALRFGRPARWTASNTWDAPEQRLRGTLRVHRFKLLATGDSMIQVTDSLLRDRLSPARRVVSEAHISTGISKAGVFGVNWVRHAGAQARSIHPDATVVWIGPNEGFAIDGAPCCGSAWIRGYAGRARSMMGSYRRGGRAAVYWLTLPMPRSAKLARVMRAVNRAIVRAARRAGSGVHVIDMRRVFTPHGHFQQRACYRGRCFDARQPDGVHLSTTGSRVAADIIARRLRADHVIRG
jgi:hypothetical protein